jgi:hypothetical protein
MSDFVRSALSQPHLMYDVTRESNLLDFDEVSSFVPVSNKMAFSSSDYSREAILYVSSLNPGLCKCLESLEWDVESGFSFWR